MSTHNIGFYEDLPKIIFQLSSKLISSSAHLISLSGLIANGQTKLAIISLLYPPVGQWCQNGQHPPPR